MLETRHSLRKQPLHHPVRRTKKEKETPNRVNTREDKI